MILETLELCIIFLCKKPQLLHIYFESSETSNDVVLIGSLCHVLLASLRFKLFGAIYIYIRFGWFNPGEAKHVSFFGIARQDVMGADVDDATAERLVKSLDLNGRSVYFTKPGIAFRWIPWQPAFLQFYAEDLKKMVK